MNSNLEKKYISFGISAELSKIAATAYSNLSDKFEEIDMISLNNTYKVMEAFRKNKVSETHFKKTTGYGYDDMGRDIIEKVYSNVFNTEDALVRIQFVNGTHTLSTALFGNLKAKDRLLAITGKPYDTLLETIGVVNNSQSLISKGIIYDEIDLKNNDFDSEKIIEYIKSNKTHMVFIGRSRGYTTRESLSVEKISKIISQIKKIDENIIVMVDNCYGEFVEEIEPTDVGADLMAGSLIKNLGGGIAETGGYIVGKKEFVENAAMHLTAPGIGKECGASLGKNKEILQGLFMAPQAVKNALKTVVFMSKIMEILGYEVSPNSESKRADIIEQVTIGNKEKLISFIQSIQSFSPIDSFVNPVPWDMPGYTDPVIMAAGTFVSGSSIELSADAPIKPPYVAYIQGGITFESASIAILKAIDSMKERN